MPDMSALSTVAYEDVTHLLGGIDLLSLPCRHRHGGSPSWFWCKAILASAVLTVDGVDRVSKVPLGAQGEIPVWCQAGRRWRRFLCRFSS